MSTVNKECLLFIPLLRYLKSKGFTVYAEVPLFNSRIDVVAKNDEMVCAYELKTGFTHKVFKQAYMSSWSLNMAYAVAPTTPSKKALERANTYGVGVIQIKDGEIIEHLPAKFNRNQVEHIIRNFKLHLMSEADETSEAGVPCMLGVGPAKDTLARVKEYLSSHPKATWSEIFQNVHSHYASHTSLSGSMRQWCGFSLSEHKKKEL